MRGLASCVLELIAKPVQTQLVGDLCGVHRVGQILFVGEYEEHGLPELILCQHAHQLVARLADSLPVVRVHHENQTLRVLEVVAPERSDLVLTADVPNRERDVLVLDRLDVETDCGDGGDDLAELQFVEDGGLSG